MEAKEIGPTLEESLYTNGIIALRKTLGSDTLLSFPTRPNGTALLLRQSFYEKMFNGKLGLLDFQSSDVNAAQVDLKNLDLQQLLFIRCENLDFQVTSVAVKAQADFLTTVQSLIEKRICERLMEGGGRAWADASRSGEISRLVLLAYGVHATLGEDKGRSDLWLLRLGTLEALLHLPSCELKRLVASEDRLTWCHRNLSLSSANVSKAKKQLHWQVELTEKPSEFKDEKKVSAVAEERRARIDAARESRLAAGPRTDLMGEKKLQEALERASAEVHRLKKELEESKLEVERARAGATGTATDFEVKLRQEVDTLKRSLAEKTKECEEAVPERTRLQEELTSMTSKLEQKSKEYDETGPELERLRQELSAVKSTLEEKTNECMEAAPEREKLLSDLASTKSQLEEKAKACEERGLELDRLQQELAAVKSTLEEKTNECKEAAPEREKLLGDLASMKSQLEEKSKECQERGPELERLQQELSTIKIALEEKTNECKEAAPEREKLLGDLASMKSQLEEKSKECEERGPELERLQQELSTIKIALEEKTNECKEAAAEREKMIGDFTSTKSQLDLKCQECDEAGAQLEKIQQELSRVTCELQAAEEKARTPLPDTDTKRALEEAQQRLEEAEARLAEKAGEFESELSRREASIADLKKQLDESREVESELSRRDASIASLQEQLDKANEFESELARRNDAVADLQKQLDEEREVKREIERVIEEMKAQKAHQKVSGESSNGRSPDVTADDGPEDFISVDSDEG